MRNEELGVRREKKVKIPLLFLCALNNLGVLALVFWSEVRS